MCFLIFLRRTLRSAAHSNYRSGFTLIELTIVMIIVGMLVAGMAQGLKVYYQKIALDKTVNNIAAVERALKKHVAENKAYPCPALYSAAASTPAYGQPDCISSEQIGTAPATVLVGMVPARILGLPDSAVVDGWGKKLTYGITQAMTVSGSITGDDTIDAKGVISVIDEANVERAKPPAQAPYVVISHGQDGRGAYTPAGTKAEDCNTAAIDGKNCDFSDIIFRFTENRSYTGNNNNYDDFIGFNVPMGVAPVGDICSLQSKFYVGIGALGADENGCKAPAPIMKRIVFSTPGTHTWKVPKGVHSAFVSMAGGGGSGSGWRVISTTYTGASGGFVFSHP
ncbi:MAG: type II secretion system protein, partial [Micavibrio sp.]